MKSSHLLDLSLTQIILLYTEVALTKLVAWVVRNSGIWDTQERERDPLEGELEWGQQEKSPQFHGGSVVCPC